MGRAGAFVTIVIGVAVLGLAMYMRPVVPDGWGSTEGTVVNLRPQTDSEGAVSYTTVVQFTTASGEQRTVENSFAFSGPGGDQLGDKLLVTYNPADPSQARILGGITDWLWYIPLAIGGAFLLFGLIVLLLRTLRR